MPRIPKIIHCVWVGGGNLRKYKGYEGIQSWKNYAPDYNIILWTDPTRLMAALIMRLINKYRQVNRLYLEAQYVQGKGSRLDGLRWDDHRWAAFLNSLIANENVSKEIKQMIERDWDSGVENYNEMLADMEQMGVVVRDLNSLQALPAWAYNVEMATRGINFAGASDIVRYAALVQDGGVYIDVDLQLQKRLGQLSIPDQPWCDLLVGILPSLGSRPKVNKDDNTIFARMTNGAFANSEPYITNALLATIPGGRAIRDINLSIQEVYDRILPQDPTVKPQSITIQKYWYSVPTKSTLDITGPNLVRDVLLGRFVNINDFITFSRERLSFSLKGLGTVKDLYEKQFRN
ncbi:MAG: TcdA/TcdB catalytic glycosyltransferase domain-containing protein, partial [Bacteroidota bacterium]